MQELYKQLAALDDEQLKAKLLDMQEVVYQMHELDASFVIGAGIAAQLEYLSTHFNDKGLRLVLGLNNETI